MILRLVAMSLLLTLSSCACVPDDGEGYMDSGYFSSCWGTAKRNAKPSDGLAPRPI